MEIVMSRRSMNPEQPLASGKRAAVAFGAAMTVLVFYVAAAAAVVLLCVLVAAITTCRIVAGRVGMAHVAARLSTAPSTLVGIVARGLWAPSTRTHRLVLLPGDAPGLFDMVRAVAERLGVAMPRTICVRMDDGAWVLMTGFRRGAGRTTLGIGFDVLAGLEASDVEAVVAHELAHVKLVRRGVARWLNNGVGRAARVSTAVSAFADVRRAANEPSKLANGAETVFGALTLRAVRLVAGYSRQDEFEADRLAAGICGTAALGAALTKIERLHVAVEWLPWSERLARMQPGRRFGAWLVAELTRALSSAHEPAQHAADPYSTHPSTRDRLAALPPGDLRARDRRAGIELLADADGVAARLAAELERALAIHEERDSRDLRRWAEQWARRPASRQRQAAARIATASGALFGIVGLVAGFNPDNVTWISALLLLGVFIDRFTIPATVRELPVPKFGTLSWTPPGRTPRELNADIEVLAKELRHVTLRVSEAERLHALVGIGYDALAAHDYPRAFAAAHLALRLDADSIEGTITLAIAAAAMGDADQALGAIERVRASVGLTASTLAWGAAWALTLLENGGDEGLLLTLQARHPEVATFAALLSYRQCSRAKLQSAVRNAEAAAALEPENRAIACQLAHALLLAGRATDAARRLEPLTSEARGESKLAFLMLRLALLQDDAPAASDWARVVRELDPNGGMLVALGNTFGAARLDDQAAAFFQDAIETGFAPEGHLGLATVATHRGDPDAARRHLLAGLRFEGSRITSGPPGDIFHLILARLNALSERRLDCRAWLATFEAGRAPLAERSLIVYATSETSARDYLGTVASAMAAGDPAFDASSVRWREAPEDKQPLRPVLPGVQGIVA